jgi:hypothetical protein
LNIVVTISRKKTANEYIIDDNGHPHLILNFDEDEIFIAFAIDDLNDIQKHFFQGVINNEKVGVIPKAYLERIISGYPKKLVNYSQLTDLYKITNVNGTCDAYLKVLMELEESKTSKPEEPKPESEDNSLFIDMSGRIVSYTKQVQMTQNDIEAINDECLQTDISQLNDVLWIYMFNTTQLPKYTYTILQTPLTVENMFLFESKNLYSNFVRAPLQNRTDVFEELRYIDKEIIIDDITICNTEDRPYRVNKIDLTALGKVNDEIQNRNISQISYCEWLDMLSSIVDKYEDLWFFRQNTFYDLIEPFSIGSASASIGSSSTGSSSTGSGSDDEDFFDANESAIDDDSTGSVDEFYDAIDDSHECYKSIPPHKQIPAKSQKLKIPNICSANELFYRDQNGNLLIQICNKSFINNEENLTAIDLKGIVKNYKKDAVTLVTDEDLSKEIEMYNQSNPKNEVIRWFLNCMTITIFIDNQSEKNEEKIIETLETRFHGIDEAIQSFKTSADEIIKRKKILLHKLFQHKAKQQDFKKLVQENYEELKLETNLFNPFYSLFKSYNNSGIARTYYSNDMCYLYFCKMWYVCQWISKIHKAQKNFDEDVFEPRFIILQRFYEKIKKIHGMRKKDIRNKIIKYALETIFQ